MAQKIKQVKKLYKSLIKDENSVFYAADSISKTLINRARKSLYDKDKVFAKLYKESENIEEIYFDENSQPNLPLKTPFIEKKRDIDFFYSFKGPFELLHADIADLRFLIKSAVDPKRCLLIVDLFISKIYTYRMIKRIPLKKIWNNSIKIF